MLIRNPLFTTVAARQTAVHPLGVAHGDRGPPGVRPSAEHATSSAATALRGGRRPVKAEGLTQMPSG